MKDNRTSQLCETCNSHIISYHEDGKRIFECQNCGKSFEDIDSVDLERYIDD